LREALLLHCANRFVAVAILTQASPDTPQRHSGVSEMPLQHAAVIPQRCKRASVVRC
jgi:hypothetical protein